MKTIESKPTDNKDEFRQIFKEGFKRRGSHELPDEEVADQLFEDWYCNEYLPTALNK